MPHHSNLAYTPFDGSEPAFKIGLRPFDPSIWLEPDHCLADHIDIKKKLISEIPDKVFLAEEDTLVAQSEVLDLVISQLSQYHADTHIIDDDAVTVKNTEHQVKLSHTDETPLLTASLMVQEDLVLMRKSKAGWRLVAGSVCFPSSWSLEQKIGKPLHEVHDPVPEFSEGTRNASMIERIFDNLQVDLPAERFNWSVYGDDQLFHDDRSADRVEEGANHYLRVERQTLTKLPASGDILFTIRIHIDPFDSLLKRADRASIASGFIDLLKKMTPAQLQYKGLDAGREILITRLQTVVDGA